MHAAVVQASFIGSLLGEMLNFIYYCLCNIQQVIQILHSILYRTQYIAKSV